MPPSDRQRQEDRNLLVRLEERIITLQKQVEELDRKLVEQDKENKSEYVNKKEFTPVQRAVYAAIGFILTSFLGTIFALVFKVH